MKCEHAYVRGGVSGGVEWIEFWARCDGRGVSVMILNGRTSQVLITTPKKRKMITIRGELQKPSRPRPVRRRNGNE